MITRNEAILILQMLAGAKADPNQSDYMETCKAIKSLNDKCIAVVKQADADAEAERSRIAEEQKAKREAAGQIVPFADAKPGDVMKTSDDPILDLPEQAGVASA